MDLFSRRSWLLVVSGCLRGEPFRHALSPQRRAQFDSTNIERWRLAGDVSVSELDDLRALTDAPGPFLTIVLPATSRHDDAGQRFDIEWKNARKLIAEWCGEDELGTLDATVAEIDHGEGEAVIVIHAASGPTLVEFLDEPVDHMVAEQAALPRLVTLLEARQRTIAHVVVETDRAGADLIAFDGGHVLAVEEVDGETLHIHRGHPGGWSQRRFQQRAENTWERNAGDVADAVAAMAAEVDAQLIAVAGDVRAQTFVLQALPHDIAERAIKVDAGSPAGIADEVVRAVSNLGAERIRDLADQLRTALSAGTATIDVDDTLAALAAGRVDTLLVHDDGSAGPTRQHEMVGIPVGVRVVDAAVVQALRTDARIVVTPRLAVMSGPIAALLRW